MSTPEDVYDLKSVKLPYLSGRPLKLFASFLESGAGNAATKNLLDSAGITWLRDQPFDEPPTFTPLAPRGDQPAATSGIPPTPHPPSAPPSTQAPISQSGISIRAYTYVGKGKRQANHQFSDWKRRECDRARRSVSV